MRKNDKGREDTLLAKMYGSNSSIQGQIHLFKRLGGLGRGRTREGGGRNESSLGKGNLAVGFESMLGAKIHGSELGAGIHGSEVGATDLGAELGAKIMAPRYRPHQRHLGCPAVHGQAPRSQDLWRRDVLPQSHESWRQPPGSKDKFTSSRGPNVKFLQKRDQIVKRWTKISVQFYTL